MIVIRTANGRAAALMVASMLGFAFEDLFLKRAANAMPPGQILAILGLFGGLTFWILAARKGQPILCRDAIRGVALLRTLSEALAGGFYLAAMAVLPLSINSAILQASPLMVTLGAALFLKEPVGWRRWFAILVGFTGVMIILRPSGEGLHIGGLLTLASVFALAARDLLTRRMPSHIGTFQVAAWAYLILFPSGLLLMAASGTGFVTITPVLALDLAGALLIGIVAYWAVTAATREGEASVVAPFRYTRLVFVMVLAVVFLGERPDIWTLAGSALIVGSGLYSFAREARRKALPKARRAG
ncbi:MAG: DMT family transporter [Pseudorhodobacter sp.]